MNTGERKEKKNEKKKKEKISGFCKCGAYLSHEKSKITYYEIASNICK
jgi:hypothetical protein